MKRPLLLGLITVFSLSIFAQENAIDKYFKAHDENPVIRENEEGIQEFVAVVRAEQSFVIASLYGTIDVSRLSKMMEVMKNGGGDWLGNFNNLHSEEITIGKPAVKLQNGSALSKVSINDISLNIYPNPATDYINITTENGASAKMKVGFYSLLGKEIQSAGEVDLPYKMDLNTLSGGTYFLRITDETGTYKNFKVVKPVSH